ncbi:hypothetical protein HRI_000670000 [Hibiscus trionum]|uniref:UTP--glucose-1-phosphate uridylyltransferase n=1 Tax=Hibiscus trionum TaxID=183268 RepID=A0A9W7LMG1_HIBTR|nr:hypothetical protein HRI_000670000 [Hibiscus trionum]
MENSGGFTSVRVVAAVSGVSRGVRWCSGEIFGVSSTIPGWFTVVHEILNHLAQNSIEYCSEVMPTTSTGLINFMASSLQGKFKLEDFTSDHTQKFVKGFKFIDTRNLWLDLKAIKRLVGTTALSLNSLSNSKVLFT